MYKYFLKTSVKFLSKNSNLYSNLGILLVVFAMAYSLKQGESLVAIWKT